MKLEATPSKAQETTEAAKPYRTTAYHKVLDGRKQPIRGLWRRGDNFVARLTVEDARGRKLVRWKRLEGAQTIPQAQKALAALLGQRDTNTLPVLQRTPKFADYAQTYLRGLEQMPDAKRPATVGKERGALARWIAHLGETRLDRITKAQINDFRAQRQAAGISGRTVNLDVIALRNVFRKALHDDLLKFLPTENLRPLRWTAKKRTLVTAQEIQRIADAGIAHSKNGQQLADYLWLMAYSGARRNETLSLRWADVDFERGQLTIGADGMSKNRESRVADFNPQLEAHLRAMHGRRAPDSQWLFPSPQRGNRDEHAKSFMESLKIARNAAGLGSFGFHDCRHFFISFAVMSGVDFMTIARFVGHKDGGILIGKVYGHLNDAHAKAQAQRINFGPLVVGTAVG
jgi:integrase